MFEDRPNAHLMKYIKANASKLTIYDQNGKSIFDGYGDVSKTQDSLIISGDFGNFEMKNSSIINYEVSSIGFDWDSEMEVKVTAYLNQLPDANLQLQWQPLVPHVKLWEPNTAAAAPLPPAYMDYIDAKSVKEWFASIGWIPSEPVTVVITLTPEQTLEILQAAKNLLIENGWRKGAFSGEESPGHETYCTLGAIAKVMLGKYGLGGWGDAMHTEPAKIIAGIISGDIPAWNDALDRTFADVMDVFDKAILAAKEKVATYDGS